MQKIFKISQKSCNFWIFFCFSYMLHCSAIFWLSEIELRRYSWSSSFTIYPILKSKYHSSLIIAYVGFLLQGNHHPAIPVPVLDIFSWRRVKWDIVSGTPKSSMCSKSKAKTMLLLSILWGASTSFFPVSCYDYWFKNPNRLKMFKTCILNMI